MIRSKTVQVVLRPEAARSVTHLNSMVSHPVCHKGQLLTVLTTDLQGSGTQDVEEENSSSEVLKSLWVRDLNLVRVALQLMNVSWGMVSSFLLLPGGHLPSFSYPLRTSPLNALRPVPAWTG